MQVADLSISIWSTKVALPSEDRLRCDNKQACSAHIPTSFDCSRRLKLNISKDGLPRFFGLLPLPPPPRGPASLRTAILSGAIPADIWIHAACSFPATYAASQWTSLATTVKKQYSLKIAYSCIFQCWQLSIRYRIPLTYRS